MKIQQRISKILSTILAAALCISPELMNAAVQQGSQSSTPQQNTGSQTNSPANQSQQGNQQSSGTTVDPTKAPLQPVTTYPDAPTPQQEQQQQNTTPTTTTTVPEPQTQKPVTEPVGAAAAERVPTAGGAASKPAGAAIAPAKQHQTRSLFLNIGAIAAGGLAAGSIYAQSKGTSSKPPGATGPGVTQK